MNPKINNQFIKLLLATDFLSLQSSRNFLKSKNVHSAYTVSKDSELNVSLNVVELIKSLKQIIRLLQFIKSQKNKQLTICTSNKQLQTIFSLYFSKLPINKTITVTKTLSRVHASLNVTQALLLLEEPLYNNKRVFKKLFEENVFLLSKLNSKTEQNNWGTYKVYNDLYDFKKVVFLIALLNQTLKES